MTSEIKNLYISKKPQELCGVPLTLQTSKQTEPTFLAIHQRDLTAPAIQHTFMEEELWRKEVTKYCRATEALGLLGLFTDTLHRPLSYTQGAGEAEIKPAFPGINFPDNNPSPHPGSFMSTGSKVYNAGAHQMMSYIHDKSIEHQTPYFENDRRTQKIKINVLCKKSKVFIYWFYFWNMDVRCCCAY